MPLDKENQRLYVDYTNGYGITLPEIARCLHYYRRDTDGNINLSLCVTKGGYNRFAKFKPQNKEGLEEWTEQERKDNKWGMNGMPVCTTFKQLWNNAEVALTWPAPAPPFRFTDWENYYHLAPQNLIHQMVGTKLVANAVFPDGVTIPFYILQRTGKLALRGLGNNLTGIDISQHLNIPTALRDSCIMTEDLSWESQTLYGTTPYKLGIVVYNQDGSVAQKTGTGVDKNAVYTCSKPLEIPQETYDMNMYIMQPALSLSKGNYYAVGAAIYAPEPLVGQAKIYTMLPLQSVENRPNKFELSVSGAEAFEVTKIAVDGNTGTNITTMKTDLNVTFTVKNNAGRRLEYSIDHITSYVNKWAMTCGIAGDLITNTGTTAINTTRSDVYKSIFVIEDGGTIDLTFKLSNIWSNAVGTLPTQINQGSKVVITPKLAFDGEALTQVDKAITITYGL